MGNVLLCAVMQDGKRVFFVQRSQGEHVRFGLPCVIARESDNPVSSLQEAIRMQTSIDAQVREVVYSGKHNEGSRRHKRWIPALAFSSTAKNYATPVPCKWMTLDEARHALLTRESEWIVRKKDT